MLLRKIISILFLFILFCYCCVLWKYLFKIHPSNDHPLEFKRKGNITWDFAPGDIYYYENHCFDVYDIVNISSGVPIIKAINRYIVHHKLSLQNGIRLHSDNTNVYFPRILIVKFPLHIYNTDEIFQHILSCFMFSLATGRIMLIDWEKRPYIGPIELFRVFDLSYFKQKIKYRHYNKILDKSPVFDSEQIFKDIFSEHLDIVYHDPIFSIIGHGWWASPFFKKESEYTSVFGDIHEKTAFDIVVRFFGANWSVDLHSGATTNQYSSSSFSPLDNNRKNRNCFIYLHVEEDKKLNDLYISLLYFRDRFNNQKFYPIIIIVKDKHKYKILEYMFYYTRIIISNIPQKEWEVNLEYGSYPDVWQYDIGYPNVSLGYRQMSRYTAGYLFHHVSLDFFDYVIKIDSDLYVWDWKTNNPMETLQGKEFGYFSGEEDFEYVSTGLGNVFKQFLDIKNIQLKHPLIVFDEKGVYKRTNYYGCFIGVHIKEMRSNQYKDLFDFVDSYGGWFRYRWDEQKIYAFYVALYLEKNQVAFFGNISIYHQGYKLPYFIGP